MRIGFLSSIKDPFLSHYLCGFFQNDLKVEAVILDQKTFSAKEEGIFRERTLGEWPVLTPYDLQDLMVPYYFVKNHNHKDCVELINKLALDLLVNATTLRILESPVLQGPSRGVLNCHPGMLPRYRGCTCVEWAIYEDQPVGNTAHFMSPQIDEGPIIYQESLLFSKQDDYHAVRLKVYRHSLDVLVKAVEKIDREGLTAANMPPQIDGRNYRVIDEDKLQEVKQKLRAGAYAYQSDDSGA
jgi:methionyl-tRNA formyltransferase